MFVVEHPQVNYADVLLLKMNKRSKILHAYFAVLRPKDRSLSTGKMMVMVIYRCLFGIYDDDRSTFKIQSYEKDDL